MLISEFSKASGLSPDTIRFYVGKGLLKPRRGKKGGSNSYQIFSEDDVTAVRMIRLQQTLGYSLGEIARLNKEYRLRGSSPARTLELLQSQIGKLEERKAQIESAITFLREKERWIESGKPGNAPQLANYQC